MKSVKFLKFLVLGLVLTVGVMGCKKTPGHLTHIPGVKPVVTGQETPIGPARSGTTDPGLGTGAGTNPNANPIPTNPDGTTPLGKDREEEGNYILDRETFKEQTVHFDFDSSTVKPGEKGKIDGVAAFLKGQPTHHLKIEGHCDERGTDGYNMALGERRALAIREYLITVGIAADRVNTISFGEDKPAVLGHDEAAWAKNRRGEFVLMRPKN